MSNPTLFLLVDTGGGFMTVASGPGLFELEKLAQRLNEVKAWKVVQRMNDNIDAHVGTIILKQWPRQR